MPHLNQKVPRSVYVHLYTGTQLCTDSVFRSPSESQKSEKIPGVAGDTLLPVLFVRGTWFWHCPFLTLERVAGFRHFPNTSHVHCTSPEFIEVPFLEVANLWVQKHKEVIGMALHGSTLMRHGESSGLEEVEEEQLISCWSYASHYAWGSSVLYLKFIPCKLAGELAECWLHASRVQTYRAGLGSSPEALFLLGASGASSRWSSRSSHSSAARTRGARTAGLHSEGKEEGWRCSVRAWGLGTGEGGVRIGQSRERTAPCVQSRCDTIYIKAP